MPSITGDKSEKAVFLLVNVALATAWVHFFVLLFTRWNVIDPAIRVRAGLFMVFFSFWWLTSILKNRRAIPLLMATGVFMTVYDIVWKVM